MDEEVLASILRDESEALLVTEPLDGSTHICALPSRRRSDQCAARSGPDKAELSTPEASGETDSYNQHHGNRFLPAPPASCPLPPLPNDCSAGQQPAPRSWSSRLGRSTRTTPMAWSPKPKGRTRAS